VPLFIPGPATGRIGAHPLSVSDPRLGALISYGFVHHVVPGTISSYTTATKHYLTFCRNRGLRPWPVDDILLAGYIHWITLRISTQSLKMYLAGVRYSHELEYGPWRLEGNDLVRRTIRYVKRKFPSTNDISKLPVSLSLLRRLLAFLPGWPNLQDLSRDDLAFATASVVAVSAFLRGGEFLSYPTSSRRLLVRSNLVVRSIEVNGRRARTLVISVPQPKNQWEVDSVDVPCFSSPAAGPMDVVALYEAWCARFPDEPSNPAFSRAPGEALSRAFMVSRTAELMALAGIPAVNSCGRPIPIKAASWRAGGVRSALDAGLSEAMIMEYGRWRSTAWRHYLMHTPYDMFTASARMMVASVAGPVGAQQVGNFEAARLGERGDVPVVDLSSRSLELRFSS
jgi:hypothetical protein